MYTHKVLDATNKFYGPKFDKAIPSANPRVGTASHVHDRYHHSKNKTTRDFVLLREEVGSEKREYHAQEVPMPAGERFPGILYLPPIPDTLSSSYTPKHQSRISARL